MSQNVLGAQNSSQKNKTFFPTNTQIQTERKTKQWSSYTVFKPQAEHIVRLYLCEEGKPIRTNIVYKCRRNYNIVLYNLSMNK